MPIPTSGPAQRVPDEGIRDAGPRSRGRAISIVAVVTLVLVAGSAGLLRAVSDEETGTNGRPTAATEGSKGRRSEPDIVAGSVVRDASFGPRSTSCRGVRIAPDDAIQSAIDEHPAETTFCLTRGVHRLLLPLRAKDGQTFIGLRGAVLSGARVVRSFESRGRYWVATGQRQEADPAGVCLPVDDRSCQFAEGVFVDGHSLRQVTDLDALTPRTFYFDYAADEFYLDFDPEGHRVEASVAPTAFDASTADRVRIRNIILGKFANPAQTPALQMGDGWVVTHNEIRDNHGVGVASGSNSVLRGNDVHDQGQLGLSGYGARNAVVTRNEVARNNTEGFDPNWEAGGSKWVLTRDLVVRNNFVHDNEGNGLWTDIDNIDTLYEGNRVIGNSGVGILHEISYDATIRNNVVARNGLGREWVTGGGIIVAASPDVEVVGNIVRDNGDGIILLQSDRGSGLYGPYIVENASIRRNKIIMCHGVTGAARTSDADDGIYRRNNRFERNTYVVDSPDATRWMWSDVAISMSEWQEIGHDREGVFRTTTCP